MSKTAVTVYMGDYDHIAPLVRGDVVPADIDLKLVLGDAAAVRAEVDPSVQIGEIDFSRYLLRLAEGDRTFVGLPVFVARGFRHRDFFVRRAGGPRSLKELEGKRVGIGGWEDAASVWSRAMVREQGVGIDRIQWALGPVDTTTRGARLGPSTHPLPPHVQVVPPGRDLLDMLLSEELDALISPVPPEGFYREGSPIVRLIGGYRQVEQDYLHRTEVYPAHHILAIRRELFDRDPSVARRVYEVFERSKIASHKDRKALSETSPWTLADIEESTAILGPDWRPNGVDANHKMIRGLCDELLVQGLIAERLDPSTAFAEFERV